MIHIFVQEQFPTLWIFQADESLTFYNPRLMSEVYGVHYRPNKYNTSLDLMPFIRQILF